MGDNAAREGGTTSTLGSCQRNTSMRPGLDRSRWLRYVAATVLIVAAVGLSVFYRRPYSHKVIDRSDWNMPSRYSWNGMTIRPPLGFDSIIEVPDKFLVKLPARESSDSANYLLLFHFDHVPQDYEHWNPCQRHPEGCQVFPDSLQGQHLACYHYTESQRSVVVCFVPGSAFAAKYVCAADKCGALKAARDSAFLSSDSLRLGVSPAR
jgi:hypothetical protein